jgi:toxin ParE1/3/4
MRNVRIAGTATSDLLGIWTFVAEDDTELATQLVMEIVKRFALLRDNPLMGRQQDQILTNLRSFPVKRFLIFYQPSEDHVDILRVLHGSRDVNRILEQFFNTL